MFGLMNERGSLLSPKQTQKSNDWNHIIASLTTEIKNYQQPLTTYNTIKLKQKGTNSLNWKKARTRKIRCRNAWSKSAITAELPLVNKQQITRNMVNVAAVLESAHKFKELLRLKKILSNELFDKLREQFRIIDAHNNGFITKKEVRRVNVLLAPHLTLDQVDEDVDQLFTYFNSNCITEMQWLQAWAETVLQQNYDLDAVKIFVDSFDAVNNEETDFKKILSSQYAEDLGINVFMGMNKWKGRAKLKAKVKREQEMVVAEVARMKAERVGHERAELADKKKMTTIWR